MLSGSDRRRKEDLDGPRPVQHVGSVNRQVLPFRPNGLLPELTSASGDNGDLTVNSSTSASCCYIVFLWLLCQLTTKNLPFAPSCTYGFQSRKYNFPSALIHFLALARRKAGTTYDSHSIWTLSKTGEKPSYYKTRSLFSGVNSYSYMSRSQAGHEPVLPKQCQSPPFSGS